MPQHQTAQLAVLKQTYELGNHFFALSTLTSMAEDTTLATIFGSEVVDADGYTTPAVVYSAPFWDAGNVRAQINTPDINYSNGGSVSITYRTKLLIACPSGHTRIVPQSVTQANFDGATDTITITGHGYVDNDRVLFAVASGTLDTALSNTVRYYVFNATANTFQVSVDQVNPVNLNGDGATLIASVIDASLDEDRGGISYQVNAVDTTVAPGAEVTIRLPTSQDTVL